MRLVIDPHRHTAEQGHHLTPRFIGVSVVVNNAQGDAYGVRFGTVSWLVGVLIALKFKDLEMYRDFLQQECSGSQVMDYLDSVIVLGGYERLTLALEMVERLLHLDNRGGRLNVVMRQLQALADGRDVGESHYLSKRVRGLNQDGAKKFLDELNRESVRVNGFDGSGHRLLGDDFVDEIGRLIDLHKGAVEESRF